MISDRLLDSNRKYSEEDDELKLRPSTLNEYIGQEDMKKNLSLFRAKKTAAKSFSNFRSSLFRNNYSINLSRSRQGE